MKTHWQTFKPLIKHSLANAAVLIVIGGIAVGLDRFARVLIKARVAPWIVEEIEFLEYACFIADGAMFLTLIGVFTYRMMRSSVQSLEEVNLND